MSDCIGNFIKLQRAEDLFKVRVKEIFFQQVNPWLDTKDRKDQLIKDYDSRIELHNLNSKNPREKLKDHEKKRIYAKPADKWDMSLYLKLINPGNDKKLIRVVENLRLYRNFLAHPEEHSADLSQFTQKWSEVQNIAADLQVDANEVRKLFKYRIEIAKDGEEEYNRLKEEGIKNCKKGNRKAGLVFFHRAFYMQSMTNEDEKLKSIFFYESCNKIYQNWSSKTSKHAKVHTVLAGAYKECLRICREELD